MTAFGFGTPFFEQLEFFRQKLKLPTARWDDITKSAHDQAFIVAGAAKADLLDDLQQAVFSRMADGRGLEAFRKDFRRIVSQRGWHGWTGEGSKAGEAWRTKVIYQTNMATSYAAGRYKQLTDPAFLKLRPYWRYVHSDSVLHPRPLHLAWGNARLTLRHDDPFWRTHFPPNGWGCHCRVTPVEGPLGEDATAPPAGWNNINPKTGAPEGIDKGFDYAPGANANNEQLRQMILAKAEKLPPALGAALVRDLNDLAAFTPSATTYVGAVSADFRQTVDAAMASIPYQVRQTVADAGWRVTGGPTLIDIAPRLANERPINAPPDVTWAHVDGIAMPRERTIGIAESCLLLSGRRVQADAARVGALLRHEHAHALDDAVLHVAREPNFIAAYNADAVILRQWVGRLGNNDDAERDIKKLLAADGPREAFADLFAEHYGGGTAASLYVARAMPRTYEAMKRIIEEWLR